MPKALQIDHAVENMTGLHYVNAPSHGPALVRNLHGHFRALMGQGTDDPLLYAYECLDVLPSIAAQVIALEKWVVAVIDATPDQITETGAKLCH